MSNKLYSVNIQIHAVMWEIQLHAFFRVASEMHWLPAYFDNPVNGKRLLKRSEVEILSNSS